MCRNIKTLHNFAPPATEDEIRASALQFVRKLSGFTRPSKANEACFNQAVEEVTRTSRDLLHVLVTSAPPRNGKRKPLRLGFGRRSALICWKDHDREDPGAVSSHSEPYPCS